MKLLVFVSIVLIQLIECAWLCYTNVRTKSYLELQDFVFNYWISIPIIIVPIVLLVTLIQESEIMHKKIYIYRKDK